MPVVRINTDLHFFAHVPKCAGTSVEVYLTERFGPLAFENRHFLKDPEVTRWTKSSPQHVPLDAFHKLVPPSWIGSSFAVVRHPITRLRSAFRFQADHEAMVPDDWTIDHFFANWLERKDREPFLYDGHLRPQSDLVPEGAAIFQMEQGLDALVAHFDKLAGDTNGSRSIPAANVGKADKGGDPARYVMSDDTRTAVTEYYAEDFRRFGYEADHLPKRAQLPSSPGVMARLLEKVRRAR